MTTGQYHGDPGPDGSADVTGIGEQTHRAGPMPPRMEPPRTEAWPAAPPAAHPTQGALPPGAPQGAFAPGPPQGAFPPGPAPGAFPPGPPQGAFAPGVPGGVVAAPMPGPRRLAWTGIVAMVLAFLLIVVVIFQGWRISDLNEQLAGAQQRLSQQQTGADQRLGDLEGRTADLERQAGKVFDPEAVATAVLPSVFRVAAGEVTGTAFAVGKPSGSTTSLFTNFHVVEGVWSGGGRQVSIERQGERYPAEIVGVDETNDVAQLRTDNRFTGLVMAPEAVKSGQQIVVVGAPLGLEDSVTTGVVSAFRDLRDGSGPVIQFSAPINPGNSGGPVVNGDKQVVGIATAKARDAEGIGLAVPIKTACGRFQIC